MEVRDILDDPMKVLSRYYLLNTLSLAFFTFLGFFVYTEFMLAFFNISDIPLDETFYLVPFFNGNLIYPFLFSASLIALGDALLHYFDKKLNLMLSFLPTSLMVGGVAAKIYIGPFTIGLAILLLTLVLMGVIDFLCILNHPTEIEKIGRGNFSIFLDQVKEKEEFLETEEEKLKMKDDEMIELKEEVNNLQEEMAEEEEKLRMKEEEVSEIKTELDETKKELEEEEELLRMREENLESQIQNRVEEKMMEEEEMLRSKNEEINNLRDKLESQQKLYEETKMELVEKEQRIQSLKTEVEERMRKEMEEEMMRKIKEDSDIIAQKGKQEKVLFPFTAIVGQQDCKRALILNAIYPEVGGVLLRGEKGTAKSVTVRSLAEVLPDIKVTGCRYNCDPEDDFQNLCPECQSLKREGKLQTKTRAVKVIDLPLNVTEDRLLGSLDIEKVLGEGKKSFEPGILADAHRGILYVDEINLLDDYIVDILLDASSSKRVIVEREGISTSYRSNFIIVGSMNPEEGELRPQILDRISLVVEMAALDNIDHRMEIIKNRHEFTNKPEEFRNNYKVSMEELKDKIMEASELLPKVGTSERILKTIADLCQDFDVAGHRADIAMERGARANAAFEGRIEATVDDVLVAAKMALPHRIKKKPMEEEEFTVDVLEEWFETRELSG